MMKRIAGYIAAGFAALFTLSSCLFENDMSYPRIRADVTAFSVSGGKSVTIDPVERVVYVELEETADMGRQKVENISISSEAKFVRPFPEYLDLTEPYKFVLRTYHDYEWTIRASQTIERYVVCSNQAEEASFNLADRNVTVYVSDIQDLESVRFESMKLEAEGSEIVSTTGYEVENGELVTRTRQCSFPMELSCVVQRSFLVRDRGNEYTWTMSVLRTSVPLQVSVVPWCYSADLSGSYSGTGSPYFQYREVSSGEWTDVRDVTLDGVNMSATLTGLSAGTRYEVKAVNGDDESVGLQFVTDEPVQLPNMSFDEWYQSVPNSTWYPYPKPVSTDSLHIWYPSASGADSTRIWDSANRGLNMLSSVNPTTPEENFVAVAGPGKRAARLESKKAFGMFAAGNILTGQFLKASVTGGVGADLLWGTAFSSKPKALKGYYSYSPAVISDARAPYADKLGEKDKLQILVLLVDWDRPFLVQTATQNFVDQNGDDIIARGTIETDVDTGSAYVEFECPLVYNDYRTPKYVVMVACASLYGDYFTGGVGSVLYVDEFEFVYE